MAEKHSSLSNSKYIEELDAPRMQHPDDFLSNARTESHPHLLNVWG